MILDPDEFETFARLHASLMTFVDRARELTPQAPGGAVPYDHLPVEQRLEIHEAWEGERAHLIDAYVEANPEPLEDEDLDTVRSWKEAITGRFIVFRQLKKHAVFLDEADLATAYGVLGLTEPFEETLGVRLPVGVEATLLPFRGRIVTDGLLRYGTTQFVRGAKTVLNDAYRTAKAQGGVIVCLSELGPGPKARKVDKRAGLEKLAGGLRGKLDEIREAERALRRFQDEDEPAFRAWLDRTLAEEERRCEELQKEVSELEFLIEEVVDRCDDGEFATSEEAAEAIIAEYEAKREAGASAIRDGEVREGAGEDRSGNEAGVEAGEGSRKEGSEEEPPFGDGEPPEFVMDLMFATFMSDVRGINVDEMDPKAYRRARAEFEESCRQGAEGNRRAFEKGLSRVGADESEENRKAVKQIYRRMAKRLHPDRNADFDEEAREWWEELGAANDALDRATMERIEMQWMVRHREPFTEDWEGRLREFCGWVNERLSECRRELQEAKAHPMWGRGGEAGAEPDPETQERIRGEIQSDIRYLERMCKGLWDDLNGFRGVHPQKRRSRPGGGGKKKAAGNSGAGKRAPAKKKRGAKKKAVAKKKAPAKKRTTTKKKAPTKKRNAGEKKATGKKGASRKGVGAGARSAKKAPPRSSTPTEMEQEEFDF